MAHFLDKEAKEVSSSDSELSDEICHQGHSLIRKKPRYNSEERALSSSTECDDDQRPVESRSRRAKTSSSDGSKRSHKKRRKSDRSRSPSENTLILLELKKTNDIMTNLSKKMKRHESRLTAIENKLADTVSSSSSSTTPRRALKKDVPVEVRVSELICKIAEK